MLRRDFVSTLAIAAAVKAQTPSVDSPVQRKGRLKQCITPLFFQTTAGRAMSFDDKCRGAARLGCKGFDLVGPADWPTLKKYGLLPTMYPGAAGTIMDALNRPENHDRLERSVHAAIEEASANGVPNLITFSGNRNGMEDSEGANHTATFLNRVKTHAEEKGVTICIEYLNSKVNHKDYMFDHIGWGVDVVKRVNSPRVKILFDIYHAQIMDGNVVRNIRENIPWIGHFHTGGNPGRHEIDQTQELNYRFIAQSIADLKFEGYVAHEFIPEAADMWASLNRAMEIFDV